jgi:hypothetical protein
MLWQAGFARVGVEGYGGAVLRDLPVASRFWLPSLLGLRVKGFAVKSLNR